MWRFNTVQLESSKMPSVNISCCFIITHRAVLSKAHFRVEILLLIENNLLVKVLQRVICWMHVRQHGRFYYVFLELELTE